MAKLTPTGWHDLIRTLRKFGFDGPYVGGKHPYMIKRDLILTIPNPHRKDISIDLLTRILKQAGISKEEWIKAFESWGFQRSLSTRINESSLFTDKQRKGALSSLVELRGFEPLTSSMPRKRAPSAPQPQDSAHYRNGRDFCQRQFLNFLYWLITFS